MKKYIIISIVVITSVVLFSCFNETTAKSENKNSEIAKVEDKNSKLQIINLSKETFKQKVFNYEVNKEWKFEGNLPVIIDFYADWCRPCKMVAPILEEINNDYNGKIQIYKVNTQYEQELASVFGITGIPAFLFIPKDGQPQMSTGFMGKQDFEKAIETILLVKK